MREHEPLARPQRKVGRDTHRIRVLLVPDPRTQPVGRPLDLVHEELLVHVEALVRIRVLRVARPDLERGALRVHAVGHVDALVAVDLELRDRPAREVRAVLRGAARGEREGRVGGQVARAGDQVHLLPVRVRRHDEAAERCRPEQ